VILKMKDFRRKQQKRRLSLFIGIIKRGCQEDKNQ